MESLISFSERRRSLVFAFAVLFIILASCKPAIVAEENKTIGEDAECRARECGCKFICSYEEQENCGRCEGEMGLAQVCIAVDGECKNAETEAMARCSLSGGKWNTCGSGCGPVLVGQNLSEERFCPQVCIEQCSCPSESPYRTELGCAEDKSVGPVIIVQKRSEAGSLKMAFRASLYNYGSFREKVYCAKAEWDFDGEVETFKPVCEEYSEDAEVQDVFQASHTFRERGKHKVIFTLSKGEFAVSTDVNVVV